MPVTDYGTTLNIISRQDPNIPLRHSHLKGMKALSVNCLGNIRRT